MFSTINTRSNTFANQCTRKRAKWKIASRKKFSPRREQRSSLVFGKKISEYLACYVKRASRPGKGSHLEANGTRSKLPRARHRVDTCYRPVTPCQTSTAVQWNLMHGPVFLRMINSDSSLKIVQWITVFSSASFWRLHVFPAWPPACINFAGVFKVLQRRNNGKIYVFSTNPFLGGVTCLVDILL